MPNPKQPYPQALRGQMVELVPSGRKPSELSKEFGCHTTTILSWVRQSAGGGSAAPLSAQEREELVELRRKYRHTAWFAHNGSPTFTPSTR